MLLIFCWQYLAFVRFIFASICGIIKISKCLLIFILDRQLNYVKLYFRP